jgi:UDP-GlcNAc:undecaprenyl-phosphate/decaprenyl-phosphate GlcNAc-1-phosphate transferase
MVLSTIQQTGPKLISSVAYAVALPPLLALLISTTIITLLISTGAATLALDRPNQRSLHAQPTPRLGGVGIVGGVIAAWIFAAPELDLRLALAMGLLVGVSLADDLKSVGVAWRLSIHLASALLAMMALLHTEHGILLTIVAALATAWMINLYNFMDGSDGLAGGMAVIGFGAYGVAALMVGDYSFAGACLSVAASALGFLCFNFPPARIFMGDVGAIPLGGLAAVLGVAGWQRGNWPLWFSVVVFSPFIVDATVTLLKRAMRGARVWQAHREHYYQRLVRSGWGHRKTALAEYGLMMLCGVMSILGIHGDPGVKILIFAAIALLYVVLIVWLERRPDPRPTQHA